MNKPNRKLMSRHVIISNNDLGIAIVEFYDDRILIRQFENEEEGVKYIDEPIIIDEKEDNFKIIIQS